MLQRHRSAASNSSQTTATDNESVRSFSVSSKFSGLLPSSAKKSKKHADENVSIDDDFNDNASTTSSSTTRKTPFFKNPLRKQSKQPPLTVITTPLPPIDDTSFLMANQQQELEELQSELHQRDEKIALLQEQLQKTEKLVEHTELSKRALLEKHEHELLALRKKTMFNNTNSGSSENEAMFEALQSQLEQLSQELEASEQSKQVLIERHKIRLAKQSELEEQSLEREATIEALKMQLDQVGQELEISERRNTKLARMDEYEAEIEALKAQNNNVPKKVNSEIERLSRRNADLEMQIAFLKQQKHIDAELCLKHDQLQGALVAARMLFASKAISKAELEAVVTSAVRASFSFDL